MNDICDKLDQMIPNPCCELNYTKDYELLIAVMLSAQCTDKRVNEVTKSLFKHSLQEISQMSIFELKQILYSLGNSNKKSEYLKSISERLLKDFNGKVPNNRTYLESLPGVGRKTCNVVLSELFNEPLFAVDTHVARVANRLELTKSLNPNIIERDLEKYFVHKNILKLHHQFVLFGRYICLSSNPKCNKCLFNDKCKHKKS